MMQMQLDYARGFLDKGYAGPYRTVSCHDEVLVIECLEDYYREDTYLGTKLSYGQLQANTQGYVVFTQVKPIIDENTRFSLT